MEQIIECNNLTHYYGKRLIYENLSFTVPKGRILGLLGKNGTGKTTTINILSGYLKPRSGECRIFGQDIQTMDPALRRNIGLLIEGHVQYQFMTITQIEKFYAAFYPGQWRKDAYYELILDDFSLGLDPGYRRLFTDYLRDYARSENKTVFLTSHIIQDMERLIDDCIIMDYGKILVQQEVKELLDTVRRYTCTVPEGYEPQEMDGFYHPSVIRRTLETYSFLQPAEAENALIKTGVPYSGLHSEKVSLEDAFIGLTGKY